MNSNPAQALYKMIQSSPENVLPIATVSNGIKLCHCAHICLQNQLCHQFSYQDFFQNADNNVCILYMASIT